MKRLRLERWSGQLTQARPRAALPALAVRQSRSQFFMPAAVRYQSTGEAAETTAPLVGPPTESLESARKPHPSPLPEAALKSAKLSALHARLCLSPKLPLQTLARALVDPSADESPNFNNASLAYVGKALINYHTSELLLSKYPRLPMAVLFEAMRGYAGPQSLYQVAKTWGIEYTNTPGGEVDPGLLQWSDDPSKMVTQRTWSIERPEAAAGHKYRRGWSSRVVYDDEFGEPLVPNAKKPTAHRIPAEIVAEQRKQYEIVRDTAYSSCVRALVGAVYMHCGREVAKSFIKAHILSRNLELDKMFVFRAPLMELSKLCAREGFERPVARLESETGRLSRTPVYVVGIYSGTDKLGEGIGSSLDFARWKAGMNALKSWYLYSPGANPRVPSDMLVEGAKPWKAPYIDIGELIIDP